MREPIFSRMVKTRSSSAGQADAEGMPAQARTPPTSSNTPAPMGPGVGGEVALQRHLNPIHTWERHHRANVTGSPDDIGGQRSNLPLSGEDSWTNSQVARVVCERRHDPLSAWRLRDCAGVDGGTTHNRPAPRPIHRRGRRPIGVVLRR